MKFLAVCTLLASFAASSACPNLAGTYTSCRTSTGELSAGSTVSQSLRNGITTYWIISIDEDSGAQVTETIVADGVARTNRQIDDQSGTELVMVSKASCMGNALMLDAVLSAEGESLAILHIHVSKNAAQMTTVTTGTSMGESINETEVCE